MRKSWRDVALGSRLSESKSSYEYILFTTNLFVANLLNYSRWTGLLPTRAIWNENSSTCLMVFPLLTVLLRVQLTATALSSYVCWCHYLKAWNCFFNFLFIHFRDCWEHQLCNIYSFLVKCTDFGCWELWYYTNYIAWCCNSTQHTEHWLVAHMLFFNYFTG